MSTSTSDEHPAGYLTRIEAAADAYVRGDMDRYVALVPHADEFTLLPPYGGPAGRHANRADELRASTNFITEGSARLEHVETHRWGDTLVVAMIERQHGRLQGRQNQELSLRVTHVYRHQDGDWRLVHRHADPLVESMSLDELATMLDRAAQK